MRRAAPLSLAAMALTAVFAASAGAAPSRGVPVAGDTTAARDTTALRKLPDFTGVWGLDLGRSDFPKAAGSKPTSRTDTIVHREPVVTVRMTVLKPSGDARAEYRYVTDGNPTTNKVAGQDVECRAWWEGQDLRVHTHAKILLFDVGTEERWSLSSDRRALTVRRHLKGPFGEGDQTLVFSRR